MDKEYEELLVKYFFKKKMQDRIIFELSSEKKRRNALDATVIYDETKLLQYLLVSFLNCLPICW